MVSKIIVLTAVVLGLLVGVALADAPNPIPGTTKVDSYVVNPDGSRTIVIEGQWNWTTHKDCPKDRDGVGYQVAWFDGNTTNPIGQNNSPLGIIYVGDAADNMNHSLNNLDPANSNLAFTGLPASYLAHNTTSATPTNTDAQNWNSNCGTTDPVTTLSTGTWGPIAHTYPASFKGAIQVCPIMYDPHGKSENAGGSGTGDVTSGGNGARQRQQLRGQRPGGRLRRHGLPAAGDHCHCGRTRRPIDLRHRDPVRLGQRPGLDLVVAVEVPGRHHHGRDRRRPVQERHADHGASVLHPRQRRRHVHVRPPTTSPPAAPACTSGSRPTTPRTPATPPRPRSAAACRRGVYRDALACAGPDRGQAAGLGHRRQRPPAARSRPPVRTPALLSTAPPAGSSTTR